jgi:prophage antirepressor-like protein
LDCSFYQVKLHIIGLFFSFYLTTPEEIKISDNNCIVKAFENNPISILQEDINNKKVYYFKGSDIGKALHLTNIRQSIQSYDDDEKVVRKAYDPQGTLQDTVFLTSQGVYRLLYNSKKEIAKKFRKWAGNILDDIIFNESAELKRQLEEQRNLIEEKENELEKTKKQLEEKTKLKVRKWYDCEPGHTIYAVKNQISIKIGKTKNIKDRERDYLQDMFYMKKCYNCDLAEQVIHHILDKYRIENNKEYFEISNELAIYTIDIVCDFMDKFINYSEELPKSNIKENLTKSLELIRNKSDEIKEPIETNLNVPKLEIPDINYNKNPIDFEKFVNECCELGETEEYYTSPFDLLGCYRLWSRGEMTNKTKHLFSKYMKNKFQFKDKFIAEYGSRFCVYLGIRPKKLEFKPDNELNLTKYEEFFIEKCHTNYSFRIRYSTFIDTYKEWLNSMYPNINYTKDDEIEIKAYFNKKFLLSRINMDGARGVTGLWGFQLKTDKYPKYGFQTRLRKVVYMIDLESKTLLNTYESLLESSEKLEISNRTLSDYIRLQKPFEYCNKKVILKYTKE